MFIKIHLKQKKGWRLEGAIIITQTNPFLVQQEHNNITSLSDRIMAITRVQCCAYSNNRYKDIISHLAQMSANKERDTAPFINELKIQEVFKDKNKEEGASVIDLIN